MKKTIIYLFIFVLPLLFFFSFYGCLLYVSFPKKYEKAVLEYSKEYNLSPYLVFAVIKAESGFNPKAVSKTGAVGLMQIMPKTAKWIAGNNVDLFNPTQNIKIGCKYLSYLQSIFLKIECVLSAYNAGPNKTKVWLMDEKYGDGVATLRKTPYKETNDYIKKVLLNIKIYKILYKF